MISFFKAVSKPFKQRHGHIILVTLLILAAMFVYLRFEPIQRATVPYTYDQGRDFLAARDIVVEKDLTLIGPTTGAGGVFHGAAWYYFLAIPFALTGGSPLAFYYFITIAALAQGLLFYYFLQDKLHPLIGLFFMSLIAISPYFVRTSIFAISSIMTLPFILLLMYAVYQYFDTKKLAYLALTTFSVGMILEGEVAFGAFLLPAFVLTTLVMKRFSFFFGSIKKVLYAAGGFMFATSLRILFELKNGFLQTKAIWMFKDTPGTNEVSLKGALGNRIILFKGYYSDLFIDKLDSLGWIVLIAALLGIWIGWKKFNDTEKYFAKFISFLTVFLFIISLWYKKNFFWPYYFEGIQFLFVGILLIGLYGLYRYNKENGEKLLTILIAIFILFGGMQAYEKMQNNEQPKNEGLRMHTEAINYIFDQVGSEKFCLRIYTPPVRTHTYDYLLDYHARTHGRTYPRTVYIDKECWYLIESDQNEERRSDWIYGNIPAEAEKTHEHSISDNLIIQRWHYPVNEPTEE